ncbi:MAG: hypothetical protein HRT89_03665 [Lentisphaeria bacterium]|nr:LamG domain-containing protein [Lentisphaeria bacterium]NQZ67147.1 hypothetical protein [Lentisphaeria bacterium]
MKTWTDQFLVISLLALISLGSANAADDLTKAILEMTEGAHTKVVWLRSVVEGKGVPDGHHSVYSIMCFDTKDGKERVLVKGPIRASVPFLTRDGERVIYSGDGDQVHVVDWNGKNDKVVTSGSYGLCTSVDPKDKKEWLYVMRNGYGGSMIRIKIDNPKKEEVVWPKGTSKLITLRISTSEDGTRMGGEFAWPRVGVAETKALKWTAYGSGCNAYIAPDNSYRFFHMVGNHRTITMYNPGGGGARSMTVTPNGGGEYWNPKWSTHLQFMTVVGPFPNTLKYTKGCNVFLGRFDKEFNKVEKWVQVSKGQFFDTSAHAWIESAASKKISKAKPSSKRPVKKKRVKLIKKSKWYRAVSPRALFLWPTGKLNDALVYNKQGIKIEGFGLTLRDLADLNHNYVMDARGGSFFTKGAGAHILSACKKSGEFSLELFITPAALKLKGEDYAEIMSNTNKQGSQDFILAQKKNLLYFSMATAGKEKAWIPLFKLTAKRYHIIITYKSGTLICFKNGRTAKMINSLKGGFGSWKGTELVFGSSPGRKNNWDGLIEGVVVNSKFMTGKTALRNYKNFKSSISKRKKVPLLKISAKLLAKSAIQPYHEIKPYFQELAVFEYSVDKVNSGKYKGKKIRVLHWVMKEKKILPIAKLTIGKTVQLVLEPVDRNKQLTKDFLSNSLKDDDDAVLYYDIRR